MSVFHARTLGTLFLLTVAESMLAQQPFIPPKSIVNAASYLPPGVPGGAIAQGSMFSIFGRNLGPATPAQVSAFPLGATFQGVSIRVVQGQRSVDVLPVYVSATQINAILPSNAPLGMVSLQVTFNGSRGNMAPVRVVANSPGLFTATGYGAGPGIFQNYVSATEQPINSALNAVKPGQLVTLWGTGLGPITAADNIAPPVGNLAVEVAIWVGNKPVTRILYSGRAPCCSAVDQIVFEVPADAPEGCFVPVQLKAGDAVSNTATMAINKDGSTCVDSGNPVSTALAAGKKTGLGLVTRVQMRADTSVATNRDFTGDFAGIYLNQAAGMPFAYDPIVALPPEGACSTYTANGDLMGGASLLRVTGEALNAGALTVTGSRGTTTLSGLTLVGLSGELPGTANLPLFLDAGTVTLRAAGGPDVGAFSAGLTPGTGVNWTNRDSFNLVARNTPLTLRFTGAGSRPVVVGGIGVDLPANVSAMFLCSVPRGAESFTVPGIFTSNFPASRTRILRSPGALFVGVTTDRQSLSATGLDAGAAVLMHVQSKTVIYR